MIKKKKKKKKKRKKKKSQKTRYHTQLHSHIEGIRFYLRTKHAKRQMISDKMWSIRSKCFHVELIKRQAINVFLSDVKRREKRQTNRMEIVRFFIFL